MRHGMIWLAGCALLAGCGGDKNGSAAEGDSVAANTLATPTPAPASPAAPLVTDGWIGRWIGVEGLNLQIAAGGTPGTYRLDMALMDSSATYQGKAAGDTIQFTRDGKVETLRHTSGAETGLKWLADKKDCLTVKEGIGFCRG